jgi:hypothetical protein
VFLGISILGKSYRFRRGDRVGLCPPLWHRDAELYPEPFRFKPERWVLCGGEGGDAATAEEAAAAAQGKIRLSKGGRVLPRYRMLPRHLNVLLLLTLLRFCFARAAAWASCPSGAV